MYTQIHNALDKNFWTKLSIKIHYILIGNQHFYQTTNLIVIVSEGSDFLFHSLTSLQGK